MPDPDEGSQDALRRLDKRLEAFETKRGTKAVATAMGASGDGYRLLGQMLGGVFGGVGLGWLMDHFAHTRPWGVVGGLLIGAGSSIYATIRTASKMSAAPPDKTTSDGGQGAGGDEEDEDLT